MKKRVHYDELAIKKDRNMLPEKVIKCQNKGAAQFSSSLSRSFFGGFDKIILIYRCLILLEECALCKIYEFLVKIWAKWRFPDKNECVNDMYSSQYDAMQTLLHVYIDQYYNSSSIYSKWFLFHKRFYWYREKCGPPYNSYRIKLFVNLVLRVNKRPMVLKGHLIHLGNCLLTSWQNGWYLHIVE